MSDGDDGRCDGRCDERADPPLATYRLQVTGEFPLAQAAALVPYLRELGVSHLYSSPLLQARRGSTHGYDVADPTRIDAERGGEAGLAALTAALRAHGLGLLLDVVPNHMAAGVQNPWWRDVLARGRQSRFATFFDLDWEAPDNQGKVLLPRLGEPLGDAIAAGHLRLVDDDGTLAVAYYETRFPLTPESEAEARAAGLASFAGEEGAARLAALLDQQHWRLAFWRLGGEQLNYRRFFDVNELVGVCAEDPAVFAATHARILELWRRGEVQGLRIDHVDGLRDPRGYLAMLRGALQEAAPGGATGADAADAEPPPYVVVEKILSAGEELREEWACAGTTGYEMANAFTGLFVDPAGLAALDRVYGGYTEQTEPFEEIRYGRKKQVLAELFDADQSRLLRRLQPLAAADLRARDLPAAALRGALAELTACLPVYRTYVDARGPSEEDRAWLAQTFAEARRRVAGDPMLPLALDFLEGVLLLRTDDEALRAAWLPFVLDWQQSTGAVMAKGLEDTALYVHGRLISLNAVGGEPPGVDPPGNVGAFHARNERRAARWPHALSATSTHDSKRSEDVGARIDVLSEMPAEWEKRLLRWSEMNAGLRRRLADGREAPDRNEEVFLYQTLLGVWPLEDADRPALGERLAAYLRKALREAKTHSSWLLPDEAYEEAVLGFAADLLRDDGAANPFLADFVELAERVAPFGAWGSLAQVLLKATVPGVPDFYQGTELWDLSLVDPDNRRPVDFARRRAALRDLRARHDYGEREALLAELLAGWRDGRVKLYTTWRALAARREEPALFRDGEYLPLLAEGARARHVVAFARRRGERWAVAITPRWLSGLVGAQQAPVGDALWAGTTIPLPEGAPSRWRDAFSGAALASDGGRLDVAAALGRFPVALLLRDDAP